ncbi:hypothetical protein M0R01_00685 [bacterium]|nr:hypothetical protein [bacterium]
MNVHSDVAIFGSLDAAKNATKDSGIIDADAIQELSCEQINPIRSQH